MLTNRLQQMKTDIEGKGPKSNSDHKVLAVINKIDELEHILISQDTPFNLDDRLFEMFVKPAGEICDKCGRTIK